MVDVFGTNQHAANGSPQHPYLCTDALRLPGTQLLDRLLLSTEGPLQGLVRVGLMSASATPLHKRQEAYQRGGPTTLKIAVRMDLHTC